VKSYKLHRQDTANHILDLDPSQAISTFRQAHHREMHYRMPKQSRTQLGK
jgi:hypothetical protein